MSKRKKKKATRGKKSAAAPAQPAEKRGRGRPVELTPDVLDRIAGHVEAGNYLETAANYEGVSLRSVRLLLQTGSKALRDFDHGIDPFDGADEVTVARIERSMEFATRIRQAKAKSVVEDLATIRAAGGEHWQAIAWRLERKHPDKFGRRARVDHTVGGTDGGPVKVAGLSFTADVLKTLSEQELEVYERLCAKLGGGSAGGDSSGESTPSG